MPHLEFWSIAKAGAYDRPEAVRDRPGNDISHHGEVEMELQRNGVVEPQIFAVKRLSLHHAEGKCDQLPILPPQKEASLIGHSPSDFSKIRWRELLELQFRALEHLLVQRI